MKKEKRHINLNQEILRGVSAKFNLTLESSNIICSYPFKFLDALQREGSYKTLHLKHFGKFYVKPGMKLRMQELKETKKRTLIAKEINKNTQQFDT